MARGGLPLPLVIPATAPTQPATALQLAPCAHPTATSAVEQLIVAETPSGRWKLGDGSGRCLLVSKGGGGSGDDAGALMAGDCASATDFALGPRGTLTLKGTCSDY